ncbi:hypothetical protein QBC43DRAFT_348597 [Cladorrhinum sp. PSN259]|nr:hypothetical protein QBC43DRAFT_348597 [Cladorrhinum sp. PSN259]
MRPPSARFSSACLFRSILGLIFATPPILAATTTSSSTRSASFSQPQPSNGSGGTPLLLPFFLPDSEPLSLVASIVVVVKQTTTTTTTTTTTIKSPIQNTSLASKSASSKHTSTSKTSYTTTKTLPSITSPPSPSDLTLQIDCPTGPSPENDACRSASIYPALVTQRILNQGAGAEWRGVTSYLVGDDSTTTWTCWQGMTLKPEVAANEMVPYAQCVSTIVKSEGSSIKYTTQSYDECYLYGHMLPLVVTAGQEDVTGEWAKQMTAGGDVNKMNSGWESKMKRLGCDMDGTRTMWAGSVKTKALAAATATGVVDGNVQSNDSITNSPRIWNGAVTGLVALFVGFGSVF